jgi:hypothetical protein
MGLPESQGGLLRELLGRTQRGPKRARFTVTEGPMGAEVAFDTGAPALSRVSTEDVHDLVGRGFIEIAPTPDGRLRGRVTSAGADYAAKNLKPMAGG